MLGDLDLGLGLTTGPSTVATVAGICDGVVESTGVEGSVLGQDTLLETRICGGTGDNICAEETGRAGLKETGVLGAANATCGEGF